MGRVAGKLNALPVSYTARVLLWNQTPYQYLKRQSQADASRWVDLMDDRAGLMVASSR